MMRSFQAALYVRLLVLGLALLLGLPARSAESGSAPYDPAADAPAALVAARAQAAHTHKAVLVVFGANWCPDCRILARMMGQGRLAHYVAEHYVVVKVDIGNWDHNLELAGQLGYPIQKGIPAVSVVDAKGRLLAATQAGELASARSMGEDDVLDLFARLPTAQ